MVFAPLLVVILLAALAVTPVVIIYGPPEYQLTLDHFRREAGTIAGIARDTISAGGTAIYTSLVVPPFAYLAGMLGAVLSKWATSLVDAVAIYCEEALEFLAFITIFPALFILGDSGFIVFCALNGIGLPGDVVSALIRYGGHLTAAWTTVLSVFEVLSLWHSKAWSRTVESIIWMGYGLMCILRYLGAVMLLLLLVHALSAIIVAIVRISRCRVAQAPNDVVPPGITRPAPPVRVVQAEYHHPVPHRVPDVLLLEFPPADQDFLQADFPQPTLVAPPRPISPDALLQSWPPLVPQLLVPAIRRAAQRPSSSNARAALQEADAEVEFQARAALPLASGSSQTVASGPSGAGGNPLRF